MSGTEIIFIALLAWLVLGPKKFPEVARKVGKIVADLKRTSNQFQAELQAEVAKLDQPRAPEPATPPTLDAPAPGTPDAKELV